MPVFKYTAEDSNGTQMSGSVTATSEAVAREMLASMQLKPLYIQNSESFVTEKEVQDVKTMERKKWEPLENIAADVKNSEASIKNWTTFNEIEAYETFDTHTPLPATSPHFQKDENKEYHPFSETLRLYAGWLLAWYGLVYILGFYEKTRLPSPELPYVYGLMYSPLIFTLTCACFTFLLYGSIQERLKLQFIGSLFLFIFCAIVFVVYRTLV